MRFCTSASVKVVKRTDSVSFDVEKVPAGEKLCENMSIEGCLRMNTSGFEQPGGYTGKT
jgi:hypothetical protein